ncbi:MAG: CHAT domain-containing protein [Cyanobacteria bacterium P01_F01_bin.150]
MPQSLITFLSLIGTFAPSAIAPQSLLNPVNAMTMTLAQRAEDPSYPEASALMEQGRQNYTARDFEAAIASFQQALAYYQAAQHHHGEADAQYEIGRVYRKQADFPTALAHYEAAYAVIESLDDDNAIALQAKILNGMGLVQKELGELATAKILFERALVLHRQRGDRQSEGFTLNNLGLVYRTQANYPEALAVYEEAAIIFAELELPKYQAILLNNVGLVYTQLGQYDRARQTYKDGLALSRNIGDRWNEGRILHNIGLAYGQDALTRETQIASSDEPSDPNALVGDRGMSSLANLEQRINEEIVSLYQRSLSYYQQALPIRQELGDRLGELRTLSNLGFTYAKLKQPEQAMGFATTALNNAQALGTMADEAGVWYVLGDIYHQTDETAKALDAYGEAIVLYEYLGDRTNHIKSLYQMGSALEEQGETELAIVMYKEAVTLAETVRRDLQTLPLGEQKLYTHTVEAAYRRLAALLLQSNRVNEAQQVIDLLKLQELGTYLRGSFEEEALLQTNNEGETLSQPLEYLASEYPIRDRFNQMIAEGTELLALRSQPYDSLSSEQQQRRDNLVDQQEAALKSFNTFLDLPEVEAALHTLRHLSPGQVIEPSQLNSLQNNLRNLEQQAVLLYPLILEDRLELLLVTPYATPIRRTAWVSRQQLNQTILEFREALQNPSLDPMPAAQQLHKWLIQPLEEALSAAQAELIVYAPDRQLRYVPLAAIHDGDRWLAEQYQVNHITAAFLSDFRSYVPAEMQIFAGAFTDQNQEFEVAVGDRHFSFSGLPFAGREVENLANAVLGTTPLMDREFSRNNTYQRWDSATVIHLATHAQFVTGTPEDSFVLFGNGDVMTLGDIRDINLPHAELVVLSACETGVGGFGHGEEILGFGYQMQQTGAQAAIASLWRVSDGGTQVLMDAFYGALQTSGISKVEALRQAQLTLITGDFSGLGLDERGAVAIRQRIQETVPQQVSQKLSHPYYWAPFILIGNGL